MRRLHLAGLTLLLMAAGPEKEGMPQLNFKSPLTISQVVWGVILFATLYLLLARWALPKVGGVIEERRSGIASDLATAHAAKVQADAAIADMTEATRKARAEAQAAVSAATEQAKAEAATKAAAMNQVLDARLAEAETSIAAARQSAMGALRQVAGDAATAMISRLTGHAPDSAQVDHAVVGHLPAAAKA